MKSPIKILLGDGPPEEPKPEKPVAKEEKKAVEISPSEQVELQITSFRTTECITPIAGVEVLIPSADVTTNVPGGLEALNMSRFPNFEIIGLAGLVQTEPREALTGGEAYVTVLESEVPGYPGLKNRIIQLQRPAAHSSHRPQDALSTMFTHPMTEGVADGRRFTFASIIADGNSNVEIPSRHVTPEHKAGKTSPDGYTFIEAPESAMYAQLLARNVARIASLTEGAQAVNNAIQVVVAETSKPEYANKYGGSTGQLLQIHGLDGQFYGVNINLGYDASMKEGPKPRSDFGGIAVLSGHAPELITLAGNLQDLSHEGRRRDFDPAWLERTIDGYLPEDTLGVAMWSDGVEINPPNMPKAIAVLETLSATEIVAALSRSKVFEPIIGSDTDDASLVIFIPAKLPEEQVMAPLVVAMEDLPPEEEPNIQTAEKPAVNSEIIDATRTFFEKYLTPEQIELFDAASRGELPVEQLLIALQNALKPHLSALTISRLIAEKIEIKNSDAVLPVKAVVRMLTTGKFPRELKDLLSSS